MSDYYINYLRREHARLEAEISHEQRRPAPDQLLVARLKKLKLGIKDQIVAQEAGHDQHAA